MYDDLENIDMSPHAVGERVADAWLEGSDENSLEELMAAVHRLGQRLGNTAEIVYGDGAVSTMATAFREAADDMEMALGERVGHGERMMAKNRRAA